MAATNYTPIQLYYSTTASAAPTSGNLANGELAINITDGKLYYKDNGGVVQVIATKGAGTIGGSTTQIQYNNAGVLAGNAAMTFNNSTNVTTLTTLNLTNALGATYGGTAQSAYTQGDILYASATNTLSKLGVGTVNYILTSSGSVPQWAAPSSITVNTATNLAGGAAGSVPYQSAASTTTFLAIGAANRVMTSSGTAPQWVTALTGLTGVSSSSITNTSLTSGRVVYSTTGGAQTDDADLTFNGTTLSAGGYSTSGLSTLVKTVTIGNSNFDGSAVFAAATPAKLYIGTGTVTDTTSAIGATNAVGAISSLAITPIAATNTSVTYTNAATLYIAGAPSAGTNVTLTNPYSLYVAAGAAYFGGGISGSTVINDGTANGVMYLNGSKVVTSGSAFTFDGANILTLFRTTSTEANEPTIKFSNLTFAGQNPGVVKSSNGGLALDIQSGSDSTYQLRSRIYVEGGAANTISFQASSNNGSTYDTRMALTNTGLGVGITPAAKLDVSNGASPASRLRVGVGAGAANTLYSTLAAGDYVSFETNGSEVGRFASTGQFGIGETSPQTYGKLVVRNDTASGAGSGGASTIWLLNANATANNASTIFFGDNAAAAAGAINFVNTNHTTDYGQISFDTNGVNGYGTRLTIDSSGALGVATTPAAWGIYFRPIQLGDKGGYIAGSTNSYSGNSHLAVGNNGYFNVAGSNWVATATDAGGATQFYQVAGTLRFNVSGPVTAGSNISFTEIANISSGGLNFPTVGSGNGNISYDGSTFTIVSNSSSAPLVFSTNSTERTRISSAGNWTVGTSSLGAAGDPRVSVYSKGNYYWGSSNGLGDFYVGNGSYGLSVGVALGGGGAGTTRMWTQNNGVQILGLGVANGDRVLIYENQVTVQGSADTTLSVNSTAGAFSTTLSLLSTSAGSSTILATQYLRFLTGGSERGRFTVDGDFLLGTTSSQIAGYNNFAENGADVQLLLERTGSGAGFGGIGSSGANALNVYQGGSGTLTHRFYVTQAGACYNTTGTYGTISDIKIKENIQDARGYLDDLCRVRVVKYSLKAEAKTAPDKLGVIAQELEQIFPGMIYESPDVVNGKEMAGTTTKTVKYSVFVPMLVKAMQEQQAIIESLKARLDAANL